MTPHVLRHTFATLALQKHISRTTIQKILAHDWLTTTTIYLNLIDTHVIEEYEQKWESCGCPETRPNSVQDLEYTFPSLWAKNLDMSA